MRTRAQEIDKLRKRVLTHHYKRAANPADTYTFDQLDELHAKIAYRATAARTPDPDTGWLLKLSALYQKHFNPETPSEKAEICQMARSMFYDNKDAFLSRDINVELGLRPLSDYISPMIGHNSRPLLN